MFCSHCGSTIADQSRFCTACGARLTDPAAAPAAPTEDDALLLSVRRSLMAEYDVERELGRGGMAVVFKARDRELERTVALKVLPPELAPVAAIADRFKREARLAASLEHPNIIPVYRVGQAGGVLYMAMKYIDGRSLDALVTERGALSLPVVLTVLRAAARAMAHAHAHGIVHRDIKAANILIDRLGRVIVSDFGIARAVESTSLTATGVAIGTPQYMSPEQCAGKPVGPPSDQYSLGILAHQLLTGAVPFDGESVPEILQHHWFTPPPDATVERPDCPAALTATVLRLLAKDPAHRFASTDDLVAALDRIPFSAADERSGEQQLAALVRAGQLADPRSAATTPATPAPTAGAASVRLPAGTPPEPGPPEPAIAGLVTGADVWAVLAPGDPPASPTLAPPTPAVASAAASIPAVATHRAVATVPIRLDDDAEPDVAAASAHAEADTDDRASEHPRTTTGERPRKGRGGPWRVAGIAAALAIIFVGGGFAVAAHREVGIPSAAAVRRLRGPDMRRIGRQAYLSGAYELSRRFFARAVRMDPADRAAQQDLTCAVLALSRSDSARAPGDRAGGGPSCLAPERAP